MQLMPNDGHPDDVSESEPILAQYENLQRSEESSSPSASSSSSSSQCEITTVKGDCVVTTDILQNLHDDETTHLVNSDQPQCRICLDIGGEDLIAPCHCRGTQKYVHRSCLDHWRSTKEGFAFAHCTECRAMFILRANVPPDRWWLRLKFQFLVARDHALIFVIVQLIVALLGVLVYKFYGEELREMFGYEEHPYGFYIMAGMFVPNCRLLALSVDTDSIDNALNMLLVNISCLIHFMLANRGLSSLRPLPEVNSILKRAHSKKRNQTRLCCVIICLE